MPALGPKTSTPLGKDPPLGTLSSSEVVCGATPFPRQRISMGSSPPQVLSMLSLTINDVILFHFLRNIFFSKKRLREKHCKRHNRSKGSDLLN